MEEPDGAGDLRRYGHSKDHRPDRPQVVGMGLAASGIPVRRWVLSGNAPDAALVEQIQSDLAGCKLSRVAWVIARGMTGESRRIALQRGGGHAIVGEKLRDGPNVAQEALRRPGRYQRVHEGVEFKMITVEDGSDRRRFVLVRNPQQAARDRAEREHRLARLEDEIDALNTRHKASHEHTRRARYLESYPSFGSYIPAQKRGQLRANRSRVGEEERLDAKYLLLTTDVSLSAEEAALGCKQLAEVRRSFRALKGRLYLRPLYHRLAARIEARVLLC
jgi:transposase